MHNFGKENAITIVALTVTIIVLLIMAGVTTYLAISNNGIIQHAQASSNIYYEKTREELDLIETIDTAVKTETAKDRTLIQLYKDGVLKVGDYINYKVPEEGNYTTTAHGDTNSNGFALQTFDVSNNGNVINWRILGLGNENSELTINASEAKCLLLISDKPIQKKITNNSENEFDKTPYLYMGKAECYENGEKILNDISKIYMNNEYAKSARSIKVEDINTILGINVENEIIYEKNDENKTNIDFIRSLGNQFTYGEDDYSAISYLNNKKTAVENGETIEIGTGYSYSISKYKNKQIGNTSIGELLFNQIDYENNNKLGYWLATRGTVIDSKVDFGLGEVCYDSVSIGSRKFTSKGKWIVQGLAVRPIIVLKPNLTIDELQKSTKVEQNWNYNNTLTFSGNLNDY